MSVAAVMLVKDEADVVGYTVRHLLTQVDEVLVADNGSSDGTREILETLPVVLSDDLEVGYYQARKMTALALEALARGHAWVVPCDADEIWYSNDGTVAETLERLDRQYHFATALLYDHVGTPNDDPNQPNPLVRLGYRFREPGKLPKVAARADPTLLIEMGNHGASLVVGTRVRSDGSPPTIEGQLVIRHFSWRSEEQFLRKLRNGAIAYAAAPEIDSSYGEHWRMFGMPDDPGFDDRVRAQYRKWFFLDAGRSDLIYDPAPASS